MNGVRGAPGENALERAEVELYTPSAIATIQRKYEWGQTIVDMLKIYV